MVFVLLTYGLLQRYWQRINRPELHARGRPRALAQLLPTLTVILIYYYQNYVARLSPLEYQELLLLGEAARQKISKNLSLAST